MTPFGIVFLPLVLFCSFTKPERLLSLLVLASIFEASSAFNSSVGTFLLGIPPFFLVEMVIACHLAVLIVRQGYLLPPVGDSRRKYLTPLLLFWIWACASAFVLPHVFAGMPVYEPRGGIDEQFESLTPLHWSLSNLAQAVYLSLNVSTLLYALHIVRTPPQVRSLLKALAVTAAVAVAAGIVQRAAVLGDWAFPYEFLNNNPGFSQGFEQEVGEFHRISSTFPEPSFAGSFISAVAIGFAAGFLRGRRSAGWLVAALAAFLVLLDTTATNGYVAFAVMLFALFLYFSPFRGPRAARQFLAKGWLILLLPIAGGSALAASLIPSLTEAAFSLTVQKSDTLSYLHRLYSDLAALVIFKDTWGLGVGLGSNRPSSLLMTFLSTVGVIGTILFALFLIRIARGIPGRSAPSALQWTFWSLMTLLVAQIIAVPDINRPVLWTLIVLVVVQLNIPSRKSSNAVLVAARHLVPSGPIPITSTSDLSTSHEGAAHQKE